MRTLLKNYRKVNWVRVLETVESKILSTWPTERWAGVTVLVACSGGADSTALAVALTRLAPPKVTLNLAHFNHGLRGDDSDGDQDFVEQLADKLGVGYHCEHAGRKVRDEASLRKDRYDFLTSTAMKIGARYVVTGHTADDQVETVLHRWCRGAGLRGLAGIQAFRPGVGELVLARPMLTVWRDEVVGYLEKFQQAFRNDASNQTIHYTRNRIRQLVVPSLLENVHPAAKQNIAQSALQLSSAIKFIQSLADTFVEESVDLKSTKASISMSAFRCLDSFIAAEVLRTVWERQGWSQRDMTAEHWARLCDIIKLPKLPAGEQMNLVFPGNIQVWFEDDRVSLGSLAR